MGCTCIAPLWYPKHFTMACNSLTHHWEQFRLSSLAQGHNTRTGMVGVWAVNLSVLANPLYVLSHSLKRDEVDLNKYNQLDQTGRKVTAPATKGTESLSDSALFTEKGAQMNECDDAAPRIARRKSKVTVVTSYGAHCSSRLAYVM